MKISLYSYFLVLSNMQKKIEKIEPLFNRMHAAEQMLFLDKFN